MSRLGGRVRLDHRTATLPYHQILHGAVMLHASCRGKLSRPEYTASRSIHFDALDRLLAPGPWTRFCIRGSSPAAGLS